MKITLNIHVLVIRKPFFELISSRRVKWDPIMLVITKFKKIIFYLFWTKGGGPLDQKKAKNILCKYGYHFNRLDEISSKIWFLFYEILKILQARINYSKKDMFKNVSNPQRWDLSEYEYSMNLKTPHRAPAPKSTSIF